MNEVPGSDGMIVADLKGPTAKLEANYGSTCGVHKELFADACDSSKGTIKEWCIASWCWVDPCTCKLGDVTRSSYFSAERYYSYSNCGGIDTYTVAQRNGATCPSYSYMPTTDCLPRMANDHPFVDSSEDWCTFGKCHEVNMSGSSVTAGLSRWWKMSLYPPSYGEGCTVHAEPGNLACSEADGTPKRASQQADWCKQAWSWVNPCECSASDMEASSYFPGLFYSYSICGATDLYTSEASRTTVASTEVRCPSPAPPTAEVASPGNYPDSSPQRPQCDCQPLGTVVPKVSCTTGYAQGGNCVNATGIPGMYPANYGASCGVHMEPLSPSCFNLASRRPWASSCRGNIDTGCRKQWCDSPFCWVDPCTCAIKDITKSRYFPDAPLYYSYANCGGVDTYSPTKDVEQMFNRTAACDGKSDGKQEDAAGVMSSGARVMSAAPSSFTALGVAMMRLL